MSIQKVLKSLRGQRGFTLLEVLIALFILGALGAALLTALQTNARATRTLDEKVQGANLAAAYLEEIRDTPWTHDYSAVGSTIPKPPQYTVTVELQCATEAVNNVPNFGPCTGSEAETLQKINVVVKREGRPVLSLCTYRSKR